MVSVGAGGEYDTEIVIKTNDNQEVKVSMNIVGMSKVLADAFEGKENDEDNDPVTLNKVDSKNLARVIDFCTHHKHGKKETDL